MKKNPPAYFLPIHPPSPGNQKKTRQSLNLNAKLLSLHILVHIHYTALPTFRTPTSLPTTTW